MKSATTFCSAMLAIFATTRTAEAQNIDAWFAFVAGDGVVVDEGPGKTLVIEKGLEDGRYEFTVRLMVNNNTDKWVNGHSNDLWSAPPHTFEDMTTKDVDGLAPWSVNLLDGINGQDPFQGDDPRKLVSNIAQAWTSIFNDPFHTPAGAQEKPMFKWTFSIGAQDAQPGDVFRIHHGIGRSQWALSPPNFSPLLVVGPNEPIATNDQSESLLPVITIVNIPEPATLLLLGFGGLVGIGRRLRLSALPTVSGASRENGDHGRRSRS